MQPTTNSSLEEMLKRQNELQYTAMAHALNGQPMPEEWSAEFDLLEVKIKQAQAEASKSLTEELGSRLQEMQYTAMAHALSGQELPSDFSKEYAELEQQFADEKRRV